MPGGEKGVLLIHGFTGLPAELLLMGQHLNKAGFTVLGVRLAGHGTTVEDMSHMTWEDWMDSVRDGYALLSGYCEDISVIGHSMGGLFALLLATEEIVSHVVTLAAPIFIPEERGLAALPPREACIFIPEERGLAALPPREACYGGFVPKARRRLKDVPPAANCTYRKMPLISIHELVDVIEKTKGAIEEVTAPVLIMHSRDDHTAAPVSADYILSHVKG